MITINQNELQLIIQSYLRITKAVKCDIQDIHIETSNNEIVVYVYKDNYEEQGH